MFNHLTEVAAAKDPLKLAFNPDDNPIIQLNSNILHQGKMRVDEHTNTKKLILIGKVNTFNNDNNVANNVTSKGD